jgi:phage baseplate assembly protein W
MIPNVTDDLQVDFQFQEQSSRTFKLNINQNSIGGFVDELEAMKQVIYLILNIERYEHIIYSWNYGIELVDLIGQPISFVIPELKRRITEALMQDSRITNVSNFVFQTSRNKVHATFTVSTIFGEIQAERGVNI